MLESFPREKLAHAPTPFEPMPRLSAALGGPQVWIKRDDCTGLGFGGNKTRKLEFLVGAAKAEGADTLLTFGARQSNHARQTAAAAARCGLGCELILVDQVGYEAACYQNSANVLLDHLFGAAVHHVPDDHAAAERLGVVLAELDDQGRKAYLIPPGGSSETGTLGYVAAGLELAEQFRAHDFVPDAVVHATSTGGTQAGLDVGLALGGSDVPVIGFNVYAADVEAQREGLCALRGRVADLLGADLTGRSLTIRDAKGPGYGLPTAGMREAVGMVAALEGITLDPVYSGKAMAALIADIRAGAYGADDVVVFVHTGGAPGLFAYAPEFTG